MSNSRTAAAMKQLAEAAMTDKQNKDSPAAADAAAAAAVPAPRVPHASRHVRRSLLSSSSSSSDDADEELDALSLPAAEPDLVALPFELGNPAVELIAGRMYLSAAPLSVDDAALAAQERQEEEEMDDSEVSDDERDASPAPSARSSASAAKPVNTHSTPLVYLLDIPAHITLHELHSFLLSSPCFASLLHMQLIRVPSRRSESHSDPTYAALLQFRTPAAASAFVADNHMAPYNSLEPDTVHAGFVVRVEFDDAAAYAFPLPQNSNARPASCSATPVPPSAASGSSPAPTSASSKQLLLAKQSSREGTVPSPSLRGSAVSPAMLGGAAGSAASLIAANSLLLPPMATSLISSISGTDAASSLPSCPVCLEAIQPAASCSSSNANNIAASAASPAAAAASASSAHTPMLTILCHHVFHLDCLSKWIPSSSSSSCPVCRYRMQPNVNTQCSTCRATDRLWMCIVCGHVGCSRYALGHAHAHFEQTAHNYAIEVLTQRVWDYAADAYVHRLVRNKTDGKLVELSRQSMDDERSERAPGSAGEAGADFGGTGGAGSKSLSALHSSGSHSSSATAAAHAGATVVSSSSAAYASVKLEEFLLEYNYLLSSQLDQQRRVFQQALRATEADMRRRREALEKEAAKAAQALAEAEAKRDAAAKLQAELQARMTGLTASHATAAAASLSLHALHTKLLSSHSSVRSSLATASAVYASQQEALLRGQDESIRGLEDQVHDLAFFLDTQKKIDKMDARSQGASARAGKIGLKEALSSGRAELQMIEVGDEEESKGAGGSAAAKKSMAARRKRAAAGQGLLLQ